MQPHRRGDDRKGEAGETGDKRCGKSAREKQREFECVKLVHGVPHAGPPGLWRDGGWGNAWPTTTWLRGGCRDLSLTLAAIARSQPHVAQILTLAGAVATAYFSRTGSCRRPVRRRIVQVLRHSRGEERIHGRRPFFRFSSLSLRAARHCRRADRRGCAASAGLRGR